MSEYKPTIGLEIHAELSTETKMFCNSKNDTEEKRPNVNVCPVCMGHPGTLPVINKEAVWQVLRLGTAVDGKLADYTEFDRKNYFYPDIPKGYQISQYKHPLVEGGELAGVKLTRVHLEEDTAKSTHDQGEESLVDFNRAGVPLMELVTEPVIHDAETAGQFARELQLLLRYLKASAANMEKGEMRVEANVSVSKDKKLGTKVEVKNLNSFKAVEKAIAYEIKRQSELLSQGEAVVQETRGWDEDKLETFSQRAKEESHDYRYFPDPDLPKLYISEIPEFSSKTLKDSLPELPWQRRQRLLKLGISSEHADIYIDDENKLKLFESVVSILKKDKLAKIASNYILTDIKRPIQAVSLAGVIELIEEGKLSSRGAKDLLAKISETETDVRAFAENNNLLQISDRGELQKLVKEIMGDHADAPVQFLVGQAMKKTQNRANPVILQELFLEMLDR